MAKKSISAKRNLKSLFSKSEANLEDSAANGGSGSDGSKVLKLFKWKKKKKTKPEADKTEKTASQNELDCSGTGHDRDDINGGSSKKLKIYGTAPRSKKGSLSYSDTDLRKPRKFGTFSFSWIKKSKRRAAGPDVSQSLEDEEDEVGGGGAHPIDLTPDPGDGTERRVRFSDSEPPGPQVNLSPPSGPVDQSNPQKAITDTSDVRDAHKAQDSATNAPEAESQTSGMAGVHVIGESGQEVQIDGAHEPASLTGADEEQGSASSAAYAALTRAASRHSSLAESASPPPSPPAAAVPPVIDSPLPGTDLPHADTVHLKNEIPEIATPKSTSEPVTSKTELSVAKTEFSDTPVHETDQAVAVGEEPKTSLLTEVIGAIASTSFLDTDLSDAATPPITHTSVQKTEVCDPVIPDADMSLKNTDLSDLSHLESSVPFASSIPKNEISGITVPENDLSDHAIPNIHTSLPNTDTSANAHTSHAYSSISDALSHDIDSLFSKTEISNIYAPNSSIANTAPNTDEDSNVIVPHPDLSSPVIIKISPVSDETFPATDIHQPANTDLSNSVTPNTGKGSEFITPNHDVSSPVIIKTVLSPINDETFFPTTDIDQPANTALSNSVTHNIDEDSNVIAPNSDLPSPVIIKTVLSPVSDEISFPTTDINQPANTALSNSVTPNTDEDSTVIAPNSDLPSPVIIKTVLSPVSNETTFPTTDIDQLAYAVLSNRVTPNTEESSEVIAPNPDFSSPVIIKTVLSPVNDETSFPKSDIHQPNTDLSNSVTPNTDKGSDVTTPNPEISSPVIIKTVLSPVNDETSFPETDISQPVNIGLSLPSAQILDTNDGGPSANSNSLNGDHTPNTNQPLPEIDLKVDMPSPGLSVTEDLDFSRPIADDLEHSRPDSPDLHATGNHSVRIPDTSSDGLEARIQKDAVGGGLATAEVSGQGDGGKEPCLDPEPGAEPIGRGPQENYASDVIVVAPPLQEKDQEGQGEASGPYQEYKDEGVIEKMRELSEQWGEERRRQEMEEEAIEKRVEGNLTLEEVRVEGQNGEEMAKAGKEEGEAGLLVEVFEVLGQKEQVKEEMEVEVGQHPQLPAMEPDSPVQQECMPKECDPTPPSPTTEGAELSLNRIVATEKHPCVLLPKENTPEREDCSATNIHNPYTDSKLIDTVTVRADTLADTVTEREDTLADTVTEREDTLTDTVTEREDTLTDTVTEREDTLTDTVTEREDTLTDTVTEDSTHSDSSTGIEDPLPSLSSPTLTSQAGRFLDDLSGPWGAVEESVSPGGEEDPDMMNSGFGVLSTTLTSKPALSRDVKEDKRQRFHKVSLVSSYDEPNEGSSPAAGRYDADRAPTGTETHGEVLFREGSSAPGEVTFRSFLESGTESLDSFNSRYSPAFPDMRPISSSGTYGEAGSTALSLEEPGSYGNSYSSSERSEVHSSWEPEPGGWDRVEPAAPAEERVWEGGINSGSGSQWLADRSLSPTKSEVPLSGVFKATLVDLLPSSPTSPDLGSPYDMDTLVDTLKSMDPPMRPRLARPPPLSTMASLPPIVEDSPVQTPKVLNGSSSLSADLGLKKRGLAKDLVTPLAMMKKQSEVDGADQLSRPLPLRASADSSIVFRKTTPASPSPEGSPSPQLNGSPSPGSSRLDNSLLFSGYRLENGKPQSTRPLTRTASLPDASPQERLSSAPGVPATNPQSTSRYERFSFLMSPTASLPEGTESFRISRPPTLSPNPLGDLGLGLMPYTSMDLLSSPTKETHPLLQRSLSVDSPLAKMGSLSTPQPEPEKPPIPKYKVFPDAYLTKEKEHGKLNPRPGKMLIYTKPGLKGERLEIRGDVMDATAWDLPETIYIRVIRGGWVLYEKPNFKGKKIALDEEDVELPYPFGPPEEEQEKEGAKEGAKDGKEDGKECEKEGEEEVKSQPNRKFVIGSLRRAVRDYSVPEISLFPEENAEGKKVIFRDTSDDARIFGCPIKANSIIIKAGLWLVYAHPYMQGEPRVLEVGGFSNPAAWGVTKPYVGSLHPLKIGEPRVEKPNEPKLVIYDKPYFSGKSRDVYTHLPNFLTRMDAKQTAFMNNACSIKVVGGCWVGYSKEGFRGHQYLLEEGDYQDWRVWGGCDVELRSVRLIRADFSEPGLMMFTQQDEEEGEEEEKMTFEVTEAIPDVELFNFPTTTQSIHVLSGAWIAYSHVDFSGNQYILEKGFYSNPGDWGATDNRICSIQPILLAPTETPTSKSQVLLYSEPDFQGQCQLCQENQESLPEKFLTKSCRVLRGSWVVYEGREYSGNLYILPEGDYPNLNSMGCPPSCSLRSLKVIPLMFSVPSISVFGLECFEGREVTLDQEVASLVDEGFNNHVLSVRVNSGCWVVCEHTNYRGRQILLEPIEVSNWLKFSGIPTIGSMHPIRQKRHFFRIKNRERGHFMSIQGGVEELKSGRVVVTEEVEGMSDIWFYQDGLIKNKMAPSMALQVMGEVEVGSKVVLWSETRQPIQIWTAEISGLIQSLTFPGMVLDMKGGKTYDRNHVIIHGESDERPSQQWEIELL